MPETFICVGGHSVSFIPEEILRHAGGAVDCVLTGEGETAITELLDALGENPPNLNSVSGCVTLDHRGPPPAFMKSLDDLLPARDLVQHRQKYFIGALDRLLPSSLAGVAPGTASFAVRGRSTDATTA